MRSRLGNACQGRGVVFVSGEGGGVLLVRCFFSSGGVILVVHS